MSAWPSLQTHLYDGWVLRVSNGYTKRANSVNPLYESQINLTQKIDYCKAFYENLGLPVIYKITSASSLQSIDEELTDLGYNKLDETSVRILDLNSLSVDHNSTSEVSFQLTQEWIDGYIRSSRIEEENKKNTLKLMLKNIIGKCVFVTHKVGDKAVGFGYGVIDNGYVGIFDIYVDESFRGNGYGKSVMNKIINESKRMGASRAYLQVVVGNTVAEKLYSRLGFEETYRYWYRKL
jgi:ribosomal protein S18 acetylase RimI-like enzyme